MIRRLVALFRRKPVCDHADRYRLQFYSVSRRREIIATCTKCGRVRIAAETTDGKDAA